MATMISLLKLHRPLFMANSPYIDSCFNLTLQQPLSSVPKVAVLENFNCMPLFTYILCQPLTCRAFSHDVTVAILVSQNNKMVAMLASQINPVGVELFSYANTFFYSNKFAY